MDSLRKEEHAEAVSANGIRMLARGTVLSKVPTETQVVGNANPVVYWSTPNGERMIAAGSVYDIVRLEEQDFSGVRDEATAVLDSIEYTGPEVGKPRFFGGSAFDPGADSDRWWMEFPTLWAYLPERMLIQTDEQTVLTTIETNVNERPSRKTSQTDPSDDTANITEYRDEPSRTGWLDQVETLKHRIETEEIWKVVLAHTRNVELNGHPDPETVFTRLRSENPDCYVCLIQPTSDTLFVAATPERLVTRQGQDISIDALAGSIKRGSTSSADEDLASSLKRSKKNIHEHELVVEAIENRLQSLQVSLERGTREVRRLRDVHHLYTPIRAQHDTPPHILDFVDVLHPTPAVGGHPREAALEAIRMSEEFCRGWYAGPIGWFDKAGDGDFAIGIRSGIFVGERGRLFAGAGIVADSEPFREWEELALKYRPVMRAFEE